jgi:hypothetical protein
LRRLRTRGVSALFLHSSLASTSLKATVSSGKPRMSPSPHAISSGCFSMASPPQALRASSTEALLADFSAHTESGSSLNPVHPLLVSST